MIADLRAPERVVFLDIDGVLNSDAFFARDHAAAPERQLDPDAVARLERVTSEGRAKIVVSSTWRFDLSAHELGALLRTHGCRSGVVGVTPTLSGSRGSEIDAWLDDHRGWRSFVILDDRDDMGRLSKRLVRTTMAAGLEDEHVARALELLERPVWARWW